MSEKFEWDSRNSNVVNGLMLQGYAHERPMPDSEDKCIVTSVYSVLRIAWDYDVQKPRFISKGFHLLTDHFRTFHSVDAKGLHPCPLEAYYGEGDLAEFTPDSVMEIAERLKAEPDYFGKYAELTTGVQSVIKIAELLGYVADFERQSREYDERQAIRKELKSQTDIEAKINIIQEKARDHFDPELLIREVLGAATVYKGERGENPDASVREMKPDEVFELGNILRIHPAHCEKYARQISDGEIKFFVAYLGNRPVARGGLMYEGPPRTEEDPDNLTENDVIKLLSGPVAWNFDMWTSEGYRGRGLAPRIALARIKEARRLGRSKIALGVEPGNEISQRYNQKLGFKIYKVQGQPFVFTAHLEGEQPQQNLLMVKDLEAEN